ncbi:Uncharacterised protein [Staphylococcus intermedius NCTC 11048]|uniref:Uncharacterized protein n=1 Tax=Staphylococcus intermedius NCTC 11048 TaxID=1141106 RepID=A0A380GBI6_STAIN|nr:Uncharacterised protein [Staphylococcus intermedius NCTC 11048]
MFQDQQMMRRYQNQIIVSPLFHTISRVQEPRITKIHRLSLTRITRFKKFDASYDDPH